MPKKKTKKRNWLLIEEIRKGGGIKSIRSFSTEKSANKARTQRMYGGVRGNRISVVKRRVWEKKF